MQGGGLSKLTACRCIAFELRQEIMKLMIIANYGAAEPVRRRKESEAPGADGNPLIAGDRSRDAGTDGYNQNSDPRFCVFSASGLGRWRPSGPWAGSRQSAR